MAAYPWPPQAGTCRVAWVQDVLMPTGPLRGRVATTTYSEPLLCAFSDARHRIDMVAAAGDVVVEGAWTGTHTGPLATPDGEVPPRGTSVNLPFATTMRASGDHVASLHIYFDQLAFMAQLGLLPQPRTA